MKWIQTMPAAMLPAAMVVVGAMALGGCHSATPDATTQPTTMPMPTSNAPMAGPAATMPVAPAKAMEVTIPAGPPPADKDLTHVLTKDEPFFLSEPGATDTPVGTLKSGSKVLVLIPGAQYSQVITDKGISAYTLTDGLKPLGK